MTLREFLENLNDFIETNPDALDLNVIASSDDEGNFYNEVVFTPTKGYLDDNGNYVEFDMYEDYDVEEELTNSVCIN
jgi:hypothetical protein